MNKRVFNRFLQITTNAEIPKAVFILDNFVLFERPSFFDFLKSGWEINLTVAVDFTASNEPVTYPDSLHFIDPTGKQNQYQEALTNVGNILEAYDTDKLIPAFGFGAIPNYSNLTEASHCFHLNGQENPQ